MHIHILKELFREGGDWRVFAVWWVEVVHGRDYPLAESHWQEYVIESLANPDLADYGGQKRIDKAEIEAQHRAFFGREAPPPCERCALWIARTDPRVSPHLESDRPPSHWGGAPSEVGRELLDSGPGPLNGVSTIALAEFWVNNFLDEDNAAGWEHWRWAADEIYELLIADRDDDRPLSVSQLEELIAAIRSGPDDSGAAAVVATDQGPRVPINV